MFGHVARNCELCSVVTYYSADKITKFCPHTKKENPKSKYCKPIKNKGHDSKKTNRGKQADP